MLSSDPRRSLPMPPTALEEVRAAVGDLLDTRHGTLRIADALVTIAVELAVREAGNHGASAWLRRIADELRAGR